MADSLSSAGLALLSWGATYLIHSTLLVAAVALCLRFHKRAGHQLRENLWKVALVGGLFTASLPMLSGGRAFRHFTITLAQPAAFIAETTRQELSVGTPIADEQVLAETEISLGPAALDGEDMFLETVWPDQTPQRAELKASLATVSAAETRHPRSSAVVPAATVVTITLAFGIAAMLLGLARCAWQSLLLSRKLARCRELHDGPARRLLEELRQTIPGLSVVRLLLAPDDLEPAAFGIGNWTIVIPERAVRDLPHDELRVLLAHELAHLVRGDSLWLGISRAVCSCLAFQPLNQLARREWQRAAEFLCDKWAVDRTGTPLALARCLAEVAGWRLAACRSNATLAATGRKTGLVDRIERLLDARPASETDGPLRTRLLVFAGLTLMVFVWCAPAIQFADGAAIRDVTPAGNAPLAADTGTPASAAADVGSVAASDTTPVDEPGDLRLLLTVLDENIAGLERELLELEPLLAGAESPPAARALAARLKGEVARLKARRAILNPVSQQDQSDQP
jgi:beta-lactamase regulating signal transducer with metallopeptidase domain